MTWKRRGYVYQGNSMRRSHANETLATPPSTLTMISSSANSRPYSRALSGRVRPYVQRLNPLGIIKPGNAIIRNVEGEPLLEVDDAKNDCGGRKKDQQNSAQPHAEMFSVALHKGPLRPASTSTFTARRYEFLLR